MSIIGEAILRASVDLLVNKLASEGIRLFARQQQIRANLKKWANMLEMIKAVLDDAEEKKTTNQSVKKWLGELQNLAYDVEDLLDDFQTEAFRRKLLLGNGDPAAAQDQPSRCRTRTSKFRKLIPTCCTTFTPQSIQFDYALMSKIKEINNRFQDIVTQKDLLDLKESSAGGSKKASQRLETTSLVIEAKVYGRETEKKDVVELLLRDDLSNDGGFSVIPIIGMGGLGKTTLAQLVYNDKRVQDHFDLKAWTCVSEDFGVKGLTKTILRSVTKQTIDDSDLNLLQEELKKKLSQKKFLLVLDDVWNENYNDWVRLSRPFEAGAKGSKIIVTTRNQEVGDIMGTASAYQLKKLSIDDCLAVFAQHSLGSNKLLEEIGKKIVAKCDGLPLAAQTLGGLLRGKDDRCDWERVLSTKIWELQEERCDIMPALRVSYYYLSAPLKQCFAYCSLFPKDYEFEEGEIILLWSAVGFLDHGESGNPGEDLGRKFFQELRGRSFFQQSSNSISRFVMHDLINDLARWAAGETYFTLEYTSEVNQQQRFSRNLRHLSYICGEYDGVERFEKLYDIQHLRTFLPLMLLNSRHGYLAHSILPRLFKLQSLRVFSLRGYCISELPDSVGDLRYLRHLNLSGTEIRTLPESVNKLYNLHTLLLVGCRRLKKLCADMGNLIKLHHLNNSNTDLLKEMPVGIGKLTCLQTCNFVVGKDSCSGLPELKLLMHLRGTLKISKLENVKYVDNAKEAQMDGKKNLRELLLRWTCCTDGSSSREAETEMGVLDMLKPHKNLEQFYICGYGGTKFPTWLGDSSFSNLVTLKFEDCGMCTALPSVGQLPSLKHLTVRGMSRVKRLGSEFYGNDSPIPFPCLETLRFEDMQEWEDWIPHGSSQGVERFPKLRELHILRCSKLRGTFPKCLPALQMLVIYRCEEFSVSVTSLPALCNLQINGCEELSVSLTSLPALCNLQIGRCEELSVSVTSLPALCNLQIGECKKVVGRSATDHLGSQNSVASRDTSNQVFLAGPLKPRIPKLEELGINNIKNETYIWKSHTELLQDICSLKRLMITSCSKLQSLVAEEEEDQRQKLCEFSCRLEYLRLYICEGLVKLPQSLLSLSSLREIFIGGCNSLDSFPEVALPSKLKKIEISECDALKSLPEAWMCDTNSSLEILYIESCHSLRYIAGVQLPPSLKTLFIDECGNIRTLTVEEGIHSSSSNSRRYNSSLLEHLGIRYCPSLTCIFSKNELPATLESLEVGNLPPSLKSLCVYGCSKLESIAERLDDNTSLEIIRIDFCEKLKNLPSGLHNLRQLQEIKIWWCGNLVTFPEGGLPCAKLTRLEIYDCKRLEALPKGLHNLKSLQELRIGGELPSLEEDDGLPTDLRSLEIIFNTKIWKSMIERGQGFHRFSSLRHLSIEGCDDDMVSFPPEAEDKRLGTALPLPASLTSMWIGDFPNLERLSSSIVDLQNLTELRLHDCPKLKYFPEKGLPSSLLQLQIWGCPLMKEKCRKDGGQYWDLLIHIPFVLLDYKWVFGD
ncbi:putative disease resistance RPP13-like protein 1 isoform X1 [Citrus clementina]|uniref:putative disease resistance RPP13-like protein 1 isoform X1 n=1 Tax=Citrus clementina TaxID=85681 RepID=UPI000CED64CA|nr:putative disease resistance RPP13-like protein 1 isoform X1 [Citrus x clementina]